MIDVPSVSAFFTADHAEVINGKVYIHGAYWNRLSYAEFPAVVPSMAVVAVFHIPYRENQVSHNFAVGLVDSDGSPMPFRVDGDFRVGSGPDQRRGDPTLMPITIPVHGMVIERPGDYSFVISVDGTELARYQISAQQILMPEME